jgi:hypothetical protein
MQWRLSIACVVCARVCFARHPRTCSPPSTSVCSFCCLRPRCWPPVLPSTLDGGGTCDGGARLRVWCAPYVQCPRRQFPRNGRARAAQLPGIRPAAGGCALCQPLWSAQPLPAGAARWPAFVRTHDQQPSHRSYMPAVRIARSNPVDHGAASPPRPAAHRHSTTPHKPKSNWLLRKEESVHCGSLRGAGF